MKNYAEAGELLDPVFAAHRLGVTSELLFQYTKNGFARASGLRALQTVERSGTTRFAVAELEAFDALLAGPWPGADGRRAAIPKAIIDHLRAESSNQCARCGSGVGVDTAHIKPWSESRSHHHANLIRLCAACHREHDAQHSLPTGELIALKNALVERTRANLAARMGSGRQFGGMPRPSTSFVGREDETSAVVEALRSGRSVMVTGVGGIGKTELLVQALRRSATGRPVFWIDVERYRTSADVLSALRTMLGDDGAACAEALLPIRLDALQACVVLDGIERATLDNLDGFEDALAELHASTVTAQFVATSQIVLHKLASAARIKIGKLDGTSSRRLLENLSASREMRDREDPGPLLNFCEGHALSLRLAAALVDHYGGPSSALRAIKARGVAAVSLPGRRRQNHGSSLELCLRTAYEAISADGRRLLWALAEAPAGLFTNHVESNWLELTEPMEALAELRRWHLIDVTSAHADLGRAHVLAPIRAFAIERANREDREGYEAVLDRLAIEQTVMVAVLESKYDDPNDTPYLIQRYGEELPNLLHLLDVARANRSRTQLVSGAISIAQALMRYFFVLKLPEQGTRAMRDAAELALDTGSLEQASALILQAVGLAQRAGNTALTRDSLALADRLERLTEDGEVLADIAMCRGLAARDAGEHTAAEGHARRALAIYGAKLRASVDRPARDAAEGAPDDEDLHNDIANALGLLGCSLLAVGRYEEAAKAYQHSLRHGRGSYVAVNRGQTLHQLGNCESRLGQTLEAAAHYFEAAEIFHFVGMEEFLSNALSELGFTLLDIELDKLQRKPDGAILDQGLIDLGRDVRRVFDPAKPLDHRRVLGIVRKLFGSVALVSLLGEGWRLGEFCGALENDILAVFLTQMADGIRDPDELTPLSMIETVSRLGLLVSKAEETRVEFGTVAGETIGDMLRMVCNTHEWVRNHMRLIDWFSLLLSDRWGFQGTDSGRMREFIRNFDDDIVDYLDLTRERRVD